jgi:hypothetical protein
MQDNEIASEALSTSFVIVSDICVYEKPTNKIIFILQVYAVFSICLRIIRHIIVIKRGFLKILKN